MDHFRLRVNNNILAALAILLILVSFLNFFVALNVVESRQAVAAASAGGEVSLCASFTPNITADLYHEINQSQPFYYDVNVSEDEDDVVYSDDTGMFNIDQNTGKIDFTPGSGDVGPHNVTITATETICNSLQDSVVMMFNITDANDPPFLIAIVTTNESSNGTNVTYNFLPPDPKTLEGPIELWEDTWYNLSVIADDPDIPYGDFLKYGMEPYVSPINLDLYDGNATFMPMQQHVGSHITKFHVKDNYYGEWTEPHEVDESANVTIIIHNVNDPPVLENKTATVGGLGATTTNWDEPFYYDVNATDEDNDTMYFYVYFISCEKLNGDTNCTIFGIDEMTGEINFTPTFAEVGNYTVNYTVTDKYDGEWGWDWYVGSFSVTEFENEPPNITDWYPPEYNITIREGESQFFNITVVDDSGIPAAQWYKDGVAIPGEGGLCYNETSNYTFVATYDDSGIYNITVMVTDGQYVVSHEWRLIVLDREPKKPYRPSPRPPLVPACMENWECTVWSVCSKEDVQIRICVDLSKCNTTLNKPVESRLCTYTPYPDCYDGIKNCHDGSCEILTDCGGPCPPCPTCSDGIRNCHVGGECEEGIDCGGPCPPCPVIPKAPVCGNAICEAGELYECAEDCLEFWLDMTILVLIIILLITLSILLYVYRKETVMLYVYRKVRGE